MEPDNLKLDALVIRLRGANSEQLTRDLRLHGFYDWQIPYVEAWIERLKEEERNAPIVLYHRRKSPTGKTFKAYEAPDLEKKGWVDSPEKFRETLWQKLREIPNPAPEPPTDRTTKETTTEKNWQNKILIYIAVGVIIVVLGAISIHLIKRHFGIPL